MVATSALGTGVDFPGIVFVLHVDLPYGMIDFAQESGRAGRGGEVVDSVVLVEEQAVERQLARGTFGVDRAAMATFVTSSTCRRRCLGEYLDGHSLAQTCTTLPDCVACDRCGEGLRQLEEEQRRWGREWRVVKGALDEMSQGCAICWFHVEDDTYRHHVVGQCRQEVEVTEVVLDTFRRRLRYRDNSHSCHRCGLSQRYCPTGEDIHAACPWPQALVPAVYLTMGGGRATVDLLRGLGYGGEEYQGQGATWSGWTEYATWLGQRHIRRVWGELMSNAMVVMIHSILRVMPSE